MGAKRAPGPNSRGITREFDPEPGVPMRMPKPRPGRPWHYRTVSGWKSLTSQSFVEMWLESDVQLALRWLDLQQQYWELSDSGESLPLQLRLSTEMRAIERDLGGSPAARASLRWTPKRVRGSANVSTAAVRMTMDDLGLC